MMINFALQRGRSDKETKTLNLYATLNPDKVKIHYFNKAEDVPLSVNFVPCGVIDWVTSILGYVPIPNYYPIWLHHLLCRNIWTSNKWPMTANIFVKPYDKPKRFKATITTGTYRGKKKPPYYCSDKVNFVDEWRYYVVDGQIIYASWYDGQNEDLEPPQFDQSVIPTNWCGCIDMGMLDNGKFALVECGEPYSIGWYGKFDNGSLYATFLIEGWKYILNLKNTHMTTKNDK